MNDVTPNENEVPGIWALLAAARWVLEEPRWLVWSNQHGAWWAPNASGYRLHVAEAGRYTLTEALSKTRLRSVEGLPPELVVPSPELCGDVSLFRSGPKVDGAAVPQADGYEDDIRSQLEAVTLERDEARRNYQFMVNRAADEKLDGYRELGARAAAAENAADPLRSQLRALREAVQQAYEECAHQPCPSCQMNLVRLRAALADPPTEALRCGGCDGPHRFDTSVPSPIWNDVIRRAGGSEYLCTSCVVKAFVRAGQSFTATLWGDGFDGVAIEVRVGSENARDALALTNENTRLRHALEVHGRHHDDCDTLSLGPEMIGGPRRAGEKPCSCGYADAMSEPTRPAGWRTYPAMPPPHAGSWLVDRPGFGPFVATVCYGMHDPWWVPGVGSDCPVVMLDGDRWRPWGPAAEEAMKPPNCARCGDSRYVLSEPTAAHDLGVFRAVEPCPDCAADRCTAEHEGSIVAGKPRRVRCFLAAGHSDTHTAYEGVGISVRWDPPLVRA